MNFKIALLKLNHATDSAKVLVKMQILVQCA